jgi:hypothetical protein
MKGINARLPEILSWLDQPSAHLIQTRTRTWDEDNWSHTMTAVKIHGIAAFLYNQFQRDDGCFEQLPRPFCESLERMADKLRARNERMFGELAEIMKAANESGLAMMPLKGSLLAQRYYETPYLRPMADLDLLVKPEDLHHATRLLRSLGYKALEPDNPAARERHLRFVKPGNENVMSLDGPDPDNPRPVELHPRLTRMLWGDVRIEDISELLWRSARETTVLGYPVLIPPVDLVFTYQAMHTLDHMMLRTARAIQFVDLSLLAAHANPSLDFPSVDWIYPALALARRCMPASWNFELTNLESRTDPRLVSWSSRVPLDHHCGLVVDPRPPSNRRMRLHHERWWPSEWRLILAYPALPIPQALIKHLRSMLTRLATRMFAPSRG